MGEHEGEQLGLTPRVNNPVKIGVDGRKLHDFGIGTYIQGLLDGLAEVGSPHHYVVFVPDDTSHARSRLAAVPRFALAVDRSSPYSLGELLTLPAQMRRHRLDLFHATHYVLPPLRPCPAVVTIHDLIHLRFPAQLPSRGAWLYAQAMLRFAAGSARRIIAVSEATRQDLMTRLSVPAWKTRVIPNGVSPIFRPAENEEAVDRVLAPLGVRRPYLLFVGNPKPHKNLPFLLDVFSQVVRGLPSLKLVIAGAQAPALRSELEARAARNGLGGSVVVLRYLDDSELPALYQGALALALPSRYEGFGLPALEAMACGTPVVAADTGGLPELVGEAGWLLPPGDPEAWLAALRTLCRDHGLRERLGVQGIQRAATFSWARTAAATESVYAEAIRGGAGV